jgi:hypothetical protein
MYSSCQELPRMAGILTPRASGSHLLNSKNCILPRMLVGVVGDEERSNWQLSR